jgi:hypothetical protein
MINEISTNRILKHFQDDKSLAIISTFRDERSLKENMKLLQELKTFVKNKLKLGFTELISRWSEYKEDTDKVESSDERSLMIYNISLEDALKLGSQYNQSRIIYKNSSKCAEVCTTQFIDYNSKEHNVGEIVRTFNIHTNNPLHLNTAKEIFAKRIGGPASKPIKSNRSFKLENVFEVESPRGSNFSEHERYLKII